MVTCDGHVNMFQARRNPLFFHTERFGKFSNRISPSFNRGLDDRMAFTQLSVYVLVDSTAIVERML